MQVPTKLLKQAAEIYLREAYPSGVPEGIRGRVAILEALGDQENVPLEKLERDAKAAEGADGGSADTNAGGCFVMRLGQPIYPYMKLVLDPVPSGHACQGQDFLLRVDAHDRHLHAPPGSPDAAWLTSVRQSNQALVEKIEGAWAAAGLPTFKEFLRRQLEARRKAKGS